MIDFITELFIMTNSAKEVLSAYSFISNLSLEQIIDVGNQSKNGKPIPSFSEDLLIKLCAEARKVFKKEENILSIDGDLIIVGDIHGSLHDLLRILKFVDKKQFKVLFLGDFVDRGNFSLECITLLFAKKIIYPDSFFLIRGNHEFDSLCSKYGFKKEILNHHNPKKFNDKDSILEFLFDDENQAENQEDHINNISYSESTNLNCYQYSNELYEAFIKTFSFLPIASIVNKTTFCVHGGLSPLLEKVDFLKCIARPIGTFEENSVLEDLVWSDPTSSYSSLYRPNHRGRGYLFNEDSVTNFLNANSLKRIVRAHQCVKNGIHEHFNQKCITVFSASSYSCDMGNYCGILKLNKEDDTVQYMMFPPIHRLSKSETVYCKVVPQKSLYFSMRHPKPVFKAKTSKMAKNTADNSKEKGMKAQRDFNGLKINCHVNPALIANYRKSSFHFVQIDKANSPQKGINRSLSLPTDLLINQDNILNDDEKSENQQDK